MSDQRFSLSGLQFWPTMIFVRQWEQHEQRQRAMIEQLRHLQQRQGQNIASHVAVSAKSGTGIYESDFDLFARAQGDLKQLVEFVRRSLSLAACLANNRPQDVDKVVIEFVDSWYHITNDGGFHDAHVHHGCSWCGIYYLQAGSSNQRQGEGAPNGGSRFYCPFNVGGGYRDFGNRYLSSSFDVPIQDGLLVLFPSFLLHSGLPYTGELDRIVLAFNARIHLQESKP